MEIFWHSLLHALEDTAIVIPILYLAYLLVSYFSHNDNQRYSKILHHTNKAGPVVGAFLGCIPQCGFSSVMSDLYSKRIVTLGTLFAVFIATSDEAIPLMIANPEFIPDMLWLILIKFVYAIIIGYFVDGMIKLFSRKKIKLNEYHDKFDKQIENEKAEIEDKIETAPSDTEHCDCDHCDCGADEKEIHETVEGYVTDEKEHEHGKTDKKGKKHKHNHAHGHCCATNIFLDALKHTAIIVAYVFVATLIINLIEGYAGGLEPLSVLFTNNVYLQVLIACLVGLIPNCAASVFLVELFMSGVLYFPALVGGLCAGAGVGLIVLFTSNYKKTWHNILITLALYVFAVAGGMLTSLFII